MQHQTTCSLSERTLVEPIVYLGSKTPVLEQNSAAVLIPNRQRPVVLTVAPGEITRLEIQVNLSASGYALYAASTVRQALELAEQATLDVIVLDLDERYEAGWEGVMISGFRLLQLLRRVTSDRPVALVVMTGLDYAEVEGVLHSSADALVNKPLLAEQLSGRLRAALERVRRRVQQSACLPDVLC